MAIGLKSFQLKDRRNFKQDYMNNELLKRIEVLESKDEIRELVSNYAES